MQNFFIVLTFLSCLNLRGSDTTGVIKGRVYDHLTGEPLFAANVIYGRDRGLTTDIKGNYLFKAEPGNINIIFKFIGYKTINRSVYLKAGDTIVFDVAMEQEVNEIDQIVVSAGKTEQKVSDLTVSMSVIKPLQIAKSHISSPEELIDKTSGIEVMDGQASIRGGSGYSYGVGSRVLTLTNGLPVLSADAGNIKWNYLPLENISQVEIIKGASSVLYGSSALNGVINFRTAEAGKVPVTSFFTETGIYGHPKRAEWKWWDTPRVFANASFSHLQKFGNTDFGIGAFITADNGYRKLNDEKIGRLNLSLKHKDKKKENLSYGINLNAGRTADIDFLLWENADSGALKQNVASAQEFIGNFFTIDPFITLNAKDHYKHDLKSRFQSTQNILPDNPENNSNAVNFYTEYQLWYRLWPVMDINSGISGNYSRVNSNFHGDHEGLNLAGYTQLDFRPTDRLKIIAGLRIEQNTLDGNRDEIVPIFRTGINYRMAGYTFLRASFGQGYRYPSIAEKYASTTVGSIIIVPNPFILPEKGWGAELGIKQGIMKGNLTGQADLSVFYSQNEDLIEYIFSSYEDPPGSGNSEFGFRATNVEQSRVYGFELEYYLNGTYKEFSTLVSGGYIFMYPVEFNEYTLKNTDVYLKYRRKHSAKISIDSEYRDFELGLNFYARSKTLNIDDVFLNEATRESFLPGFYEYWLNDNKPYLLTDASLGYRLNEKYTVSVSVKNLTNVEYMGRPGDIQPHRNYSLRFSGKF